MRQLTPATLSSLPPGVAVPAYDRTALSTGIVHLGVGGFHRAHQAVYLDRLLATGAATGWGICGVGILPQDRRMGEVLTAQSGLYTVVVKHPDGAVEDQVVGSMLDYLFTPSDPDAVVERLASPVTRIVSLTVTEGGYNVHPSTGEFDADNEAVSRDALPGAVPSTIFGLVTEALVRRRARGLPPFTVMSCDNVQDNGSVAHRAFAGFARLRDPGLGTWVEQEVRFPSSMVDRITPATADEDREALARRLGVTDEWPVVCEPFTQWVLEDNFSGDRPALQDVGVQLVADVGPYELMKLRLLNAGHQALGFLGYLAGHRYVHEAAQDPLMARFVRAYFDREATATLRPVPGVNLDEYKTTLLQRFANPQVHDTLARICADTSDRIPKFVLPVVREQLTAGGSVELAALVVAAWARYAEGVDEQGHPIEVVDHLREPLMAAAARGRGEPAAFLAVRRVFGSLGEDRPFVDAYTRALESLHLRGVRATVSDSLDRQPA